MFYDENELSYVNEDENQGLDRASAKYRAVLDIDRGVIEWSVSYTHLNSFTEQEGESTMAKIQQLDAHLTNMIAAGEVVERPMGVIKELVENALDAQATRIEVNINQGGTELMEVIDNGVGMDREDACLCFERHATSKIKPTEDLWAIHTLGFRGEALPSIASRCV